MGYLLQHLLESSAEAFPERIAIEDGDRVATYAEVECSASKLANLLRDVGVARGDRVGLYLDKSLESVVAIYGIAKTGAAYVPLDAQAPHARLAYIAGNCDIRCLVTSAEKAAGWAALRGAGAPIDALVVVNSANVDPDRCPPGVRLYDQSHVDAQPDDRPACDGIDADLAYILYTSGSTGVPKGVMLSHRNALAFVTWAVKEFRVSMDDRLSSHAPLHFDLSIFDLFAAAMTGAAVVLVPPKTSFFPTEVARFIEQRSISVWYSVPSILSMMATRGGLSAGAFPSLRTMLFAGEVFPPKYLRRIMDLLPHVRFCNLYGPTETNVCTWYDVPSLDGEVEIPIGRAIDNDEVLVMGEQGLPVPPGEVGELYVRGATVMQGYWGDVDRTARVLIPSPLTGRAADQLYRTGDLVRWDENGYLWFLGRRDAQIKSRGYRIELGEIETALYAHPQVVECAVVAVPDQLVTNRIAASVVVRDHVQTRDLAEHCSKRLPQYMVPESFWLYDTLPKTSTGKVDRQRLRGDAQERLSSL